MNYLKVNYLKMDCNLKDYKAVFFGFIWVKVIFGLG